MSEVQSHFSCCKDDASCVCNLIQFNLMHLCCIIWYSYDAISGPLSLLTSSMTRRWDLLPSLITLSTSAISATRGGRPNYRRQRCYKCGGWCQGQDVRCKCARPNNIRSQPLIIKLQRGQEGSSRQTFLSHLSYCITFNLLISFTRARVAHMPCSHNKSAFLGPTHSSLNVSRF